MLEAQQESDEWDYTIVKGLDGKIPVKVLDVTAGQSVLLRVYNFNDTNNHYLYNAKSGVTSPTSIKARDALTQGLAEQDYTISVTGNGWLKISSGSNNSEGESAYYGFYADMVKIRIT